MKRIRHIGQVAILCLSIITSAVSAQTPCDSIPDEDPSTLDGTPETLTPINPGVVRPGGIEIPLVPYIPPPIVEPNNPFIPIFSKDDKIVVNPLNPGIPVVDNKYTPGAVAGSLTVNGVGAAEYVVPIEAPNGGPLMPGLSLAYNSQNATNGIAGYGVSLSGLSAITRGEKSSFNNNKEIAGITYSVTDNLFLDGKRLILVSGLPCQEGALYCIEGDPYTKVTAHGLYSNTIVSTWFEVQTPDGKTYQYGNTPDSRLTFKNKSGYQRIASWHVNRTEDIKGNYMTVAYRQENYYPYPVSVSYGMNSVKDRGLMNKIELTYEDIGATPSYFFLETRKGSISKRIATITTSSNDQVFRKYFLTYDATSDKSPCRFARLTSIREENGNGDNLTPTKLTWSPLTDGTTTLTKIFDPALNLDSSISIESQRAYMAADVTGDGISDIILIVPGIKHELNKFSYFTFVIISRSMVDEQKKVSYQDPIIYKFTNSAPNKTNDLEVEIKSAMGGFHLSDIDGDGINDLVLPRRLYAGNSWNFEKLSIITGKNIVAGKTNFETVTLPIYSTSTPPLYTSSDFDGDGKDEILCMETTAVDGLYQASTIKLDDTSNLTESATRCRLAITEKPEKIFCGDYNNDGLTDIIVLHKNGYKIFYNRGGKIGSSHFDSSIYKTGTTMKDQVRIDQGDFNGDGLLDFVYNIDGESSIRVAYNNGDGTFDNTYSYDIGLSKKVKDEPDDHFLLRCIDLNRDGRSDVVVSKATYEIKSNKPVFKETKISWLKSNGTRLILMDSFTKTREADADEKLIFIGDFDGDGYIDLANCGSPLDRENNTVTEKTLNIYRTAGANVATGRVTEITDGLGNTSSISYGYLTSPEVYSAENHMDANSNVNTMTLPLPVVKQLNFSNGICRSNVIDYKYKDLYVQMTGAGVLGFGSVTKTMLNTGESSTDTVLDWDVDKCIPIKTKSINSVGGMNSSVVTEYDVRTVEKTYFCYDRFSTVTDMYNETVKTSNIYDLKNGVLTSQTVTNIANKMYKKVDYSDYNKVAGVWLPGTVKSSQKHEHDSQEYSSVTKYKYDDKGNIVSTTVNSGTDLELTTNATYDTYGNCLSSYSTGKSVVKITKLNEYDATGRFLVKSSQNPEAAVMTFTYDTWGNVLTENDCTESDNILTTTHTYDGWGRRSSTTLPDERKVKYSVGWGKTDRKHHYSLVEETGKPWVLTWYDEAGNETSSSTFGPKNVLIEKNTEYDYTGKVSQVSEQTGKLKSWKTFRYDGLGRLLTEKSSLGNEVTYKYGNRTVFSTTNGRTYTKATDAWGNILRSTDPSGASVIYRYGANGLPSSITTEGSVINITYDCAGNRISVSDPDAGRSTYEYAADGTLLKQTDAKGVTTVIQYDELGRISSKVIGNQTIRNIYGTSGTAKLRLTRKQLGNNNTSYTYDKYGRIIAESRYIHGSGTYSTRYTYDDDNRLSKVKYDGLQPVTYTYDNYGFKTSASFEDIEIYRLLSYDGLTMKTSFADSIISTRTVNSKGLESVRQLAYGNRELDRLTVDFDTLTLNLRSRLRKGYSPETFRYDALDRLVGASAGNKEIMSVSYARNGNILSKTGLGAYGYDSNVKPHAVTSVENTGALIPSSELLTAFNPLGLVDRIEDSEGNRKMEFLYGPDLLRCQSRYSENGKTIRTVVYANNMEIIKELADFRIYYLDDDVIFVNSGISRGLHFLFKDHLGSILSAFNVKGSKTFEASYDAWGKQDVKSNMIGLRRGYTGHEMLNEFGIINMNGRLYDPILGRFFSPDPYVQFPDFSQSYNRYSYCLNNPLKYTDPSGQLAGTAFVVASSLFQIGSAMLRAHATGGNVAKAGLASLLSSPLTSFGIGKLYGGVGSIGRELLRAGTHGLASGLASAIDGGSFGCFASGFISGGASALFMSANMNGLTPDDLTDSQKTSLAFKAALVGGGACLLTGGNFLKGALFGYNIAGFNYLEGEAPVVFEDEEGHIVHELLDLVVTPKIPTEFIIGKDYLSERIDATSFINTAIDSFGQSLAKNGANSTVGINHNIQIYWKTTSQRPFYGNQHISTQRLTTVGSKIVGKTTTAGYIIGTAQVAVGLTQDSMDFKYYGYTNGYNTFRAAASFGGALAGFKAGVSLGGIIGAHFGGIGAIPGSIIGGTVLGIIGSFWGGEAGGQAVDWIYGK